MNQLWRLPLAMAVLLFASAAFASLGHGHGPKASPDIDNFPVNSDGTISVLVQFKPEAFQPDKTFHANDEFFHGPRAGEMKQAAINAHKHLDRNRLNRYEQQFGLRFKREFGSINAIAARVPKWELDFLLSDPDVQYVSPDRPNHMTAMMFDDAPPPVNAPVARQNFGVDGTGVGVAVIDSGVYQHDDLQTADMSGSRIVYSQSFVPNDPSVNDAYGHGTHVAGIIAGDGHDSATGYVEQYIGIAPNANIINLRVLDANGSGSDSQVIAAINTAIQLKSQYNIRVINLSLGRPVFESYTLDPLCQAAEAAWKAGIVVVTAAGNMGRDNSFGENGYATIEAPGNDPNVITVGATNGLGTWTRTDDIVASYSSKGPTLLDHVVKPDLVAPGNKITSLLAPGSTLAGLAPTSANVNPLNTCDVSLGGTSCGSAATGQYLQLSGTSMAAPVVAGAAALMIQLDPTLTPDTVKARMMKDAWKGYPGHGKSYAHDIWGHSFMAQYDIFTIGAGYLDVQAALSDNTVVNGGAPSPIASFNTLTGQATLSNATSVVWGRTVVWGSTVVWGNSVVWGSYALNSDSTVWGNSVVWGQFMDSACTVVWGQSVVWGQFTTLNSLSTDDPGDTDDTTPDTTTTN